MTHAQKVRRAARSVVAAVCLFCWAPAYGQESSSQEKLHQAITHYEQKQYVPAQQLLYDIDVEQLADDEQARHQEYLEIVDRAVALIEQATQDLHDADAAIAQSNTELASSLLNQVLTNEYASAAMKQAAREGLESIARSQRSASDAVAQEQPAESAHDRANELLQLGMEAMQSGNYDDAQGLFEQVLELVPGHPDAVDALEQVRLHRQVETTSDNGIKLIDSIRQRRNILWERAVATYREAEMAINDFVAQNRYNDANQALLLARETIEGARQYADPLSKYESLRAQYDVLADMVNTRKRAYDEEKAFEVRRDLEKQEKDRQEALEQERQRQIDLLMEQADELKQDRDFEGAIQVLHQVLVVDPRNVQAEWLMEQLEDIASIRRQVVAKEQHDRETRDILIQTEEAKVPWHKEVNYPQNWGDIIRSPYRGTPGEFPLEDDEASFEETFRSRIPEVSFDQTRLDDVFAELANTGELNIVPNWPDLAVAGVTRDTPVSLNLKNVTFKTVLTEVLDQVEGGSTQSLGFDVRGELVKVASSDYLNRDVFLRVYNVKDIIHPIEHFDDAPDFSLEPGRSQARQVAQRNSGSVFGQNDASDDLEEEQDNRISQELSDVVTLIRTHVMPQSWRANGGPHASIQALADGNIVITQTAAGHQEIFNLLNQLREDQAIQIAIEARFLTVSSNFLEDMGVNLDIVLNTGNAGFDSVGVDPTTGSALLLPRNFSRLGFTPSVPALGTPMGQGAVAQPYTNVAFVPQQDGGANHFTPIPMRTGVTQITDPASLASDVPGSFAGVANTALQIAGSFLDDIQVDFLIRATQADKRTSTLIAPKLVMTNGQQAWIAITESQSYVSQLNPVVATGAAANQPIIDTLDSGAVLNVQATASPDRRYVTMNLEPSVGRLIALNTFQFSGVPTTGNVVSGFVQEPVISRQQIRTTVTIPDNGTLLVGGQKFTFDIDVEAGVPVLSKIPVLKRLYSSRSLVKDEQVLLILIKPQILIKEEQEEMAFPGMSARR